MIDVQCAYCGKDKQIWPYAKRRSKTGLFFCNDVCSSAYFRENPTPNHLRAIAKLTSEKRSKNSKEEMLRYYEHPRICPQCNNEFHTKDHLRKYCYNCHLTNPIRSIQLRKRALSKKSHTIWDPPDSLWDVSKRTKHKLLKRMNLPCSCCGFHVQGVVLDVHHIIPTSLGGTNEMSNLTYICPNCHRIAHTDISLLPNHLITLEQQTKLFGIDWKWPVG